jgi:hypothetical protein
MKQFLALPLALLLMAAVPPPQALEQARNASKTLMGDLQKTLKAALSSQGPAAAVQVCHQAAPAIAKGISEQQRLQVRRVSLKHRSPQGKPDAYEAQLLTQWQTAKKIPEEHAEVVMYQGKKVLRYLKPIRLQAACLQCHGPASQIKPEVKALLRKHYPQDQATGYKEGDLRGAVTVILPLKP